MNFTTITAESKDSKVICQVHTACIFGTSELKAVVLVGAEQSCKAIFAALNGPTSLMKVGGSYVTKCPWHYTRKHIPLPCKWAAMMIASKDPHCMWNDSPASLLKTLKLVTDTPFLEEWEPYLRRQLIEQSKLVKFIGKNAQGSYLNCTTEELDAIVVDGIKGKLLHLQGTTHAVSA